MPFTKGKSGNPSGRPKRTKQEMDLVEACKRKAPEALRVLEDIMRNGESERNRLSAAQMIIERASGNPVQAAVNQRTGADGESLFPKSTHEYTDEELAAIVAIGAQH